MNKEQIINKMQIDIKTGFSDSSSPYREGDINVTGERADWYKNLSIQVNDLIDKDRQYFIHQALSTPCLNVLKECNGIYIEDIEGNRYMDFHGNNLHQIGYRNPGVINALKDALDSLPFCPRRYTNQPAIRLAQLLTQLAPGTLNKVLFAPGGSEVNSIALKLARMITGKHKVISMWDSYHGAGLDTISVGGEQSFRRNAGPLLPGVEHIPSFNTYRGLLKGHPRGELIYADYIEYIIEQEGDIGAVMAETVRNTDVQVPSKAYWKNIRDICDYHNVLLILDEIPICLGRTGKMFAFENYDIVPDMVTLGKGLGGGVMPLAAILVRDDLHIDPLASVGHFTHEKNPLSAIAGIETIEFIIRENILEHVAMLEEYMRGRLLHLREEYPVIGDVRGIGLLWGVELVKDRTTKEKAIGLTEKIMYRCLKNGLSFKVSQGNVISLSPPLII
ncbi:MAG: aspartate aminotransferase family protein, partial [Bacteroidales bacterium]